MGLLNILSAFSYTAEFLPIVKTPSGLVGEEAAGLPAPGLSSPLNMSIKHPLIELQWVHVLMIFTLSVLTERILVLWDISRVKWKMVHTDSLCQCLPKKLCCNSLNFFRIIILRKLYPQAYTPFPGILLYTGVTTLFYEGFSY